ncbi:MAG: hypothetical protein QOK29_1213 [Rhodospirillaceae bacterium]|jgi:putative membrane protein|nr:hypothetical protein [Rhodospirillaceae bacterium]
MQRKSFPAGGGSGRGWYSTLGRLIGFGVGSLGLTLLLLYYGFSTISLSVLGAGWGLLAVMLIHVVQIAFTGAAWRAVLPRSPRPSVFVFLRLRWIREAVNALLPVAQIGGPVVGARLLVRHRVPIGLAAASATVDVTIEMVAQILFTLAGLALLVTRPHGHIAVSWVAAGLPMALLTVAGLIAAQRFGLLQLVERGLLRLAERWPALSLDRAKGLHEAARAIHANRRGLLIGLTWHSLSWVLGAAEVLVAFAALGHPVGLRQAFVIESLGAALRGAGFAVPGALGVQEAAFIFVAAPFGVPPEMAIALSMVKRLRDLAFGIPGLTAWQWSEGHHLSIVARSRAACPLNEGGTVVAIDPAPIAVASSSASELMR